MIKRLRTDRPSSFQLGLAAAAQFALLVVSGCSEPAKPPNILFILVDTLRADRLGSYGNERGLTPNLDSLASEGTVFRRAYAQSSWTAPSVASLMTSRYQTQHRVVNLQSVLPTSELALAEVLGAAGYATAGYSANLGITRESGFAQGFQTWQTLPMKKSPVREGDWIPARADELSELALAWLDSAPTSKPTFLYLHFMEPHVPFDPAPEAIRKLVKPEDRHLQSQATGHARFSGNFPPDEHMLGVIEDFYDAEVLSIDLSLGRLFTKLEARGFLDDSVVVVTADHGEEFEEHDGIGHGMTLFEEVIRVPLIVVRRGIAAPSVRDEVVSGVDLAPTLLEMAGVPVPNSFEGRSLLPLLARPGEPDTAVATRFALSELETGPYGPKQTPHYRALITSEFKFIAASRGGEDEFYDLTTDPTEQRQATIRAKQRARLRRMLKTLLGSNKPGVAPKVTRPLDEKAREQLRALGYAE